MSIAINYYFVLCNVEGGIFDGLCTVNNELHSNQHINQLKQQLIDRTTWGSIKPDETYFINLIELSRVEV